jgi:hypothetical protein
MYDYTGRIVNIHENALNLALSSMGSSVDVFNALYNLGSPYIGDPVRRTKLLRRWLIVWVTKNNASGNDDATWRRSEEWYIGPAGILVRTTIAGT